MSRWPLPRTGEKILKKGGHVPDADTETSARPWTDEDDEADSYCVEGLPCGRPCSLHVSCIISFKPEALLVIPILQMGQLRSQTLSKLPKPHPRFLRTDRRGEIGIAQDQYELTLALAESEIPAGTHAEASRRRAAWRVRRES